MQKRATISNYLNGTIFFFPWGKQSIPQGTSAKTLCSKQHHFSRSMEIKLANLKLSTKLAY